MDVIDVKIESLGDVLGRLVADHVEQLVWYRGSGTFHDFHGHFSLLHVIILYPNTHISMSNIIILSWGRKAPPSQSPPNSTSFPNMTTRSRKD